MAHGATRASLCEVRLAPGGVSLVVHVLEQHEAERHVADAGKADQRDRARHRADRAAAGMLVMRGVDHAQQLVGQRHVLQDFIRQVAQAFVL